MVDKVKVIKPKKAPLVIHVNSHNIRANRKLYDGFKFLDRGTDYIDNELLPVITVRYGRGAVAERCNGLTILGSSRLVYGDPMGCGAEVWIETNQDIMTRASVRDLSHVGKEGE